MAETDAFKARLRRVVNAAIPAAYKAALTSAREIGGAMKMAVPRDEGVLAASIRLETEEPRRVKIRAGGPTTTRPVRNGVTAKYDYALAQEFGTKEHPANPFFYPTWRLLRKRARSRINRAMKKAIEETA
jgi:hypothetical protein